MHPGVYARPEGFAVSGALLLGVRRQVLGLGWHLASNTKQLLKIAADDGFDLGPRQAVVQAGLDHGGPLLIERRL